MRRSREIWKRLVAEYRASGSTAEAFARRERLNVGTLRWWCTELRRESPVRAAAVRFLPVRATAAVPPAQRLVEAQVGGVCVRFEAGTDVEYMSALLAGLSETC